MSTYPRGKFPTQVLFQDKPINAFLELENASDKTRIKAVWTAVRAEGLTPDSVINTTETTYKEAADSDGRAILGIYKSDGSPFPTGSYKVDLYIEDELKTTLTFVVH